MEEKKAIENMGIYGSCEAQEKGLLALKSMQNLLEDLKKPRERRERDFAIALEFTSNLDEGQINKFISGLDGEKSKAFGILLSNLPSYCHQQAKIKGSQAINSEFQLKLLSLSLYALKNINDNGEMMFGINELTESLEFTISELKGEKHKIFSIGADMVPCERGF